MHPMVIVVPEEQNLFVTAILSANFVPVVSYMTIQCVEIQLATRAIM
jgi:hypothetical protein